MVEGLAEIRAQKEFGQEEYSTSTFLGQNPDRILMILLERQQFVAVEVLPFALLQHFESKGVKFHCEAQLRSPFLAKALNEAFALIALVPTLHESVRMLVKSLHALIPTDNESDVSFSEPAIPFSIFVSIPETVVKWNALRLAEAIIHEAMHLQLSLLERKVPLVKANDITFFSPWKNELRSTVGLLHACYVFAVIDGWLSAISTQVDHRYVENRRTAIKDQIRQSSHFARSADLTDEGQTLAESIFLRFRKSD
ncbi:HEXXH motif-containing putative peptide modification protein [Polaromonas sp.]|uniref:aKG-HExxH-type peptide beta-hydroxylase n=1 Tax=Polaromonas sp. TaxID=1869339 RepID=UPI003563A967